ncbi:hypothetical protein IFM89_002019 [Coptis chinensis]|uniref:Protein kinase domain-containing protein n=1 Tax=Coptis chinensis TaxID=261450 RepID=A0A835HIB3_9MAGN|nr:hypothetical protein IFM89_002019 [Coptis chinensis]
MEWVRGEIIGKGSFSSVYLATPSKDFNESHPLMAVKSASVSKSSLLQREKEILSQFLDCPQILHCFGEDYTIENGDGFYNLLLEFAPRGNLHQLVRSSGGGLSQSDVRYYTKSILQGLKSIHKKDYVHCDIKLQNILLCNGCTEVKIADFGLAKKAGEKKNLEGTPLYMSPESITRNEQEAPSDIWALGCVVVEMVTGNPAWKCRLDANVSALLFKIGFGEELPEIPEVLCEDGKDFLRKCFVRDPKMRWSADMLLNHPFVDVETVTLPNCEQPSPSPRSPYDFPDWSSTQSCSSRSYNCYKSEIDKWDSPVSNTSSPADRIRHLGIGNKKPNWCYTDCWISVREQSFLFQKGKSYKKGRVQ